jgi:F-type H+-transporting ATPase subunit b
MTTTSLAADNFLLPNGTFLAELVAFLVTLFVLWKWVLPPLTESLRQRQEMIEQVAENSEAAQRKLEAARAQYEHALAEARREAAKIRDNARADAERIRQELREQALAEVDRTRRWGERLLEAERDRVVREVRHDLGELALRLAERILRYELAEDEHRRRVIEVFLAELDRLPASPAPR